MPARRPAPTRAPAILTTNGFGGSKADQAGLGAGLRRAAATSSCPTPGSASAAAAARSPSTTRVRRRGREPAGDASSAAPRGIPRRRSAGTGRAGARRPVDSARRRPRTTLRPARRHDRRLLRRPDPVRRRGRARAAPGRHDRPADHLERPAYSLAPNNTSFTGARRTAVSSDTRAPIRSAGRAVLPASASPTGSRRAHRPHPQLGGCPNFAPRGVQGQGAPVDARLPDRRHDRAPADRVSVAHYMNASRCPTFLSRARTTRCSTSRRRSRRTAALKARASR